MPEYLAPGVYVEEVSFRSKSIEGVATSTTGFAGMTRWGPVRYTGGPRTNEPRLITSFTEFERVYGGLETIRVGGGERTPFTAHAARAFFANGGRRLYVSRVHSPDAAGTGVASAPAFQIVGLLEAQWVARWPGRMGNVRLRLSVVRTRVSYYDHPVFGRQVRNVRPGSVIEVLAVAPQPTDPLAADLRVVRVDANGEQRFINAAAADGSANAQLPGAPDEPEIRLLEVNVTVQVDAERVDFYERITFHPDDPRFIRKIFDLNDPEDEDAVIRFDWSDPLPDDFTNPFIPADMVLALSTDGAQDPEQSNAIGRIVQLAGGSDGQLAQPADLAGQDAHPDFPDQTATGLAALGEIEDIAIVALPDSGTYPLPDLRRAAADALIGHAERLRYRIAVVDGPSDASLNAIREFRGQFDSKYAAMYHPWIEILDPTQRAAQGAPPRRLTLPPSGFVCGIYARSDIERGVHKAPANEVVRGLTKFEININKGRQDVINPEGINALRFFDGRGNRVWGARTMSSDPEWKYVNVRRLFIFVEHSIDKSTQWAVFEPNNRLLWANIRSTVEDFLLVLWQQGALLGETPEQAFFVRCDRTTMTQNDLDNGRLVCLVGIAPTKPAEFVIFRIGQWTADANQS